MLKLAAIFLLSAALAPAQERKTEPTFLRCNVPGAAPAASDVTTKTCRYKPVFGEGAPDARSLRGIARYGVIEVDPAGESAAVSYPAEEQVYVVLAGSGALLYGEETYPLRKDDFLYLPAGVRHVVKNTSTAPLQALVAGFRLPAGPAAASPSKLLIANINDVPLQTVAGHPPSTRYRLLMGGVNSKRDKLAAARVLTSLFIMEFAPGGTNIPHHHENEEEIYLVLDGRGEIVAGGGMDGIEGRHPARAGDAWFFRLNCTVGFYNAPDATARILAVRSLFPGRQP